MPARGARRDDVADPRDENVFFVGGDEGAGVVRVSVSGQFVPGVMGAAAIAM